MSELSRHEIDASKPERSGRVRRVARWAVAGTGVAVVGMLAFFGKNQIEGNWDDTRDLMEFTSPGHQDSRCDIQAAFDAQVAMYEHFQEQGGITSEEAEVFAPIVGLDTEEVVGLLNTELYTMDYDCEVPEASSSEATKGMLALAGAGGLMIGAASGVAWYSLGSRENS